MALSGYERVLLAAIPTVAGLFLLVRTFPGAIRGLRALRAGPTSPGDVAPGTVSVVATPTPTEGTVEAEYTGIDCLAYETDTQRHAKSRYGGNWRGTYGTRRTVPFELRDAIGSVSVDPSEADLHLTETYQGTSGRGESAPDPETAAEQFTGNVFLQTGSTGDRRYTERRLDLAEEAYVAGVARYEDGPGSQLVIGSATGRFGPPFVVASEGGRTYRRFVLLKRVLPTILGLSCLGLGGYLFVLF